MATKKAPKKQPKALLEFKEVFEDVMNESIITASPAVFTAWQEGKVLDTKIKDMGTSLLPYKQIIQEFMGLHGLLNDRSGMRLASFKVQAKKKGDCFDFDRFIKDHPDMYQKYQKPGPKKIRVFRFD